MSLHPIPGTQTFVTVVIPLAVPKPYTYLVPEELLSEVQVGVRVEVQFGRNKRYAAVVAEIHQTPPEAYQPKPILAVIDEQPVTTHLQMQLWQWMADYYCCTIGEAMHAALPAHLKLSSETIIALSPFFQDHYAGAGLDDKEYLIAEALSIQREISLDDVRSILDQRSVYPIIRRLLDKKVIYLKEDLQEKYKPKTVPFVRLTPYYEADSKLLSEAFDKIARSSRQTAALLAYVQLSKKETHIRKQAIYELAKADATVIQAMVGKGIFEVYDREVSRLGSYDEETEEASTLSEQQIRALAGIRKHFDDNKAVLLHGVTGSGKTRVYMELIQAAIAEGGQVLYLLPEIALTAQIISRLQRVFGDRIGIYHSRLNNNERVELWNRVLAGQPVVLGARSALLLPFTRLSLIIVDEEHDPSYKQNDPNPRYNGRDTAIYLATLHSAHVLLGTATPSVETYYNARQNKYGLVEMPERFGGLEMPEVVIVDAKAELRQRKLQSHFTTVLLDELRAALERGEQAILFQNRRGYAPVYRCVNCGWNSECINCDVSLTYHKAHNCLKCHYCGYQSPLPKSCPACGGHKLTLQGFGTEKIEDELAVYLPDARIARMDLDTVRSRNAHAQLINDFEEHRLDILVGTQMVTKGLDFENVGVVGVLSADQLMQFPDFRAAERALQLMMQVSGRAGRKHKRGKVVIQAFNTTLPVLQEVINNNYLSFYERELRERYDFQYPPFTRLIRLTLKHKKPETVNQGASVMAQMLKQRLGEWVIGPAVPYISRVREYFLIDLLIKLPRQAQKISYAKQSVVEAVQLMQQQKGLSGVRVNIDVDPY